ncbi:MAG: hypothetical protein KDD47_22410 [Acidobacteria bacterium]|nr:hypothetical protein [Acidobacteriota bacterium]
MFRVGKFAWAGALALAVVALPAAAQLSNQAGVGGAVPSLPEGAPILLYDQNNNPAGNGAPDQNFEAAFDIYDSEAGDDFEVTFADGWTIEQVTTVGTQSTGGTATSVDVFFYPDLAGFPDTGAGATCTFTGVVPTSQTGGSYVVDLPAPCILPMGFHWLTMISNQTFGGGNGQHFWSNRSVLSNSGGVWRNPGNGFGSGCTDFDRQTTCGVGGGAAPDFLFQILGMEGGAGGGDGGEVLDIPTLDVVGLVALLALLAGAALYAMRRKATN